MKAGTIVVAVLFGPGARDRMLIAPGEADSRWRAVATIGRETGNQPAPSPGGPATSLAPVYVSRERR